MTMGRTLGPEEMAHKSPLEERAGFMQTRGVAGVFQSREQLVPTPPRWERSLWAG